jgi:group I intron endonuclease
MSLEERKEKFGKCGEKNGMYGKTHTEEVRKKISEMHKGNSYCKGKKLSEEIREKMSKNAKLKIGEKNPFFGKKHTEEVKKEHSVRVSGLNHPMWGKKHTEETKSLIKERRSKSINQDYLNNVYYSVNYNQVNNLFEFIWDEFLLLTIIKIQL